MIVEIPCSPEQEDVIFDHAVGKGQLGMVADERHWMLAQLRKIHPTGRITAAALVVDEGKWRLTVEM